MENESPSTFRTREEIARAIATKLASFYFAEGEDAEREKMAARIMKYVGRDIVQAIAGSREASATEELVATLRTTSRGRSASR